MEPCQCVTAADSAETLAQGVVSLPFMSLQMMQRNQRKITAIFVPKSLKLEELDALRPCGSGVSTAQVGVGRKCNFSSLSAK